MALVETSELPAYQTTNARELRLVPELGLSDRAIAVRLGVTDKTAAKPICRLGPLALLE